MTDATEKGPTSVSGGSGHDAAISLPVMPPAAPKVRRSRMSRWRALSLILVHVLMLAHIAQWLIAGRTVSPIEPSEAMYTLNDGHLNAGFLFLAASILVTLVFGRFVCGWGCHFIAYQDLCAWALKKIGIKPKAFRSRILMFAPLALALYMFVWPSAYRWWADIPRPPLSNHLMKSAFWETFPGATIGILTVLLGGFAIVYFFGGKGFCTYACPYGGFFSLADKVSPGRIRVNESCQQSGHCTSVCSSNVRVAEEVAKFGMVVDPGCMKCMDCVSVCPNDALSVGFGKPSLAAVVTTFNRRRKYDFTLFEEFVMLIVGGGSLLALRGLYGQVPLLLAMALGGMTGFLAVKLLQFIRQSNVRFQNLQFKRGGKWTSAGIVFSVSCVVWLIFVLHSGGVQFAAARGGALTRMLALPDSVWGADRDWWQDANEADRGKARTATAYLAWSDRWGFASTGPVLHDLVWLHLAAGDLEAAEGAVQRLVELAPDEAEPHRGLANVLRRAGRVDEAEAAYRVALTIDPRYAPARTDLGNLFLSTGRPDEALLLLVEATKLEPDEPRWPLDVAQLRMDLRDYQAARETLTDLVARRPELAKAHSLLGVVMLQLGEADAGMDQLRRAIGLDPDLGSAHYNLGLALLDRQAVGEAVAELQDAARLRPEFALGHYNLGVALFMSGKPAEAVAPIREAIRLNPSDPDAHGFLAVVLRELGDEAGARQAAEAASDLQKRGK
ncbi:MAG: tetratricopeptide repeat protein [Planctomycetes bacterium]|nr:tetratricopeptide repeat protein [Planctomycetota bacterium]